MKTLTAAPLLLLLATCVSCNYLREPQAGNGNVPANAVEKPAASTPAIETPDAAQQSAPRTVREYFTALPDKYFTLEGCDRSKDKGCRKARAEYLKTFVEVEDTANGYLKAGCDGAQSCLEMAVFKKPDGTYIVGVRGDGELSSESYFVDYAGGAWTDVGARIVPEYDRKKFYYEFPRVGTTVTVYEKVGIDGESEAQIGDRGKMLYELIWKDGKFTKTAKK